MTPVFKDVVCLGCGCLCDDLVVDVDQGRIAKTENACPLGESWLQRHSPVPTFEAAISGQQVPLDDAIAESAKILRQSRAPLVLGPTQGSVDSERAAIELAEVIGGTIDPGHSALQEASTQALQSVGQSTATLGEVRSRADLIIFWRSDPATTHPRFLERFVDEPGTFVQEGRSGRRLIVIDSQRTATAELADLFIELPHDDDMQLIWELRAKFEGNRVSGAKFGEETNRLHAAIRDTRYGALFLGQGIGASEAAPGTVEGLFRLVAELNAHTRFVASVMGGPVAGEVLAWQTGYSQAVDFAQGYPCYGPKEFSAQQRLESSEIDAVVVLSDVDALSNSARTALDQLPSIVVGPAIQGLSSASIEIATGSDGIHHGGTVFRMDEIALPLSTVLQSHLPSQAEVLRRITEAYLS